MYNFLGFDACKEGSHNCHMNAECINMYGSFNCSCKTGFSGNGTHCQGKFFFIIGNRCYKGWESQPLDVGKDYFQIIRNLANICVS